MRVYKVKLVDGKESIYVAANMEKVTSYLKQENLLCFTLEVGDCGKVDRVIEEVE